MKNAVLRGYLFITVVCLFLLSIAFCFICGNFNLKQTETHLLDAIHLIDHNLDYDGDLKAQCQEYNSILEENTRLTIIRTDGVVIADSESPKDIEKDNHLSRPEVQSAISNGKGTNIRYSTTMGAELMYAAALSENHNYVLRLSSQYKGKLYFASSLVPAIMLTCAIVFLLSLILSGKLAGSITRPLTEICTVLSQTKTYNTELNLKKYDYDEINAITDAINTLSKRIERTIEDIHFEKRKTSYILDNMKEGLILLDGKQNVMVINKAAMDILDCKSRGTGKSILYYTQNLLISQGIESAFNTGVEQSFDITDASGHIFNILISKVNTSDFKYASDGAIIFMPEVTRDRAAESMRQEFFSNASHELKTPITSIQGYAELLTSGIKYSDEQKEEFLQRIKNEASNMTGLINDILTISRLESGSNVESESPVSISLLIQDIFHSVEPMAKEKGLSLYTNCGNISVKADYKKLYQLANNLIVNAVKYNKYGGTVTVTASGDDIFTLNVADTGIGIPADSKARVFERFYRVDKGRSKKTAGTGLGLAIVKHVVNYYHGNIKLESQLDIGTEITVTLPIEIIK